MLCPPHSSHEVSRRSGRWLYVAALAAILLGLGLRFFNYDRHRFMDEEITTEVVGYMRQSGDWDDNWAKTKLQPDLRYDQYNFSTHLYATFFFYRITKLVPGTEAWRSRDDGFIVYRFLVACLAALVVWQTFHLTKRLHGPAAAAGAAVLAAVATLLVQDSHYVRPEALGTVLTLCVVALVIPETKLRAWRPVAAGFVVGLLVGCKVSMLMLVWLPFVPVVLHWRHLQTRWTLLLGVGFAVVVGFACGVPGAFLHPAAFLNGVHKLMTQYGGVHPPHSHLGGGPVFDMLGRYFVATLGWPLLVCVVWGLYSYVRHRRWAEFTVVACPWIVFVGYFATKSVFFERNVSHVFPLVLVVAAHGAVELAGLLAARTRLPVVAFALPLFAIVVVRPAELTARLVAVEYTGRGAQAHERLENDVRARYPQIEWWNELLMNDGPLQRLRERFQKSNAPLLLRVSDYADEWTRSHLLRLRTEFELEQVAEFPGSFPELPTCTLLAYHSAPDHYFLVRGLKSPR